VDFPMTQLQPIESTWGTHRTLGAPRTPNPVTTQGESSNQLSLERSLVDLEAQQNVEKVLEHLIIEKIEMMVKGTNNVDEDEFMDEIFNSQEVLGTRLELESHKESLKVKKSANVLIINDDDEEEESVGDALIRRKGKGIEEIRDTPLPTPISVTPLNRVPSDLLSEGVTSLNISSTKHKERPLRVGFKNNTVV
ncbi:hypothetical protein Tco_1477793, partial [Tanacetum coccineum]